MEKIKQLNEWLKRFKKWQIVTVSFVIGYLIWALFITDGATIFSSGKPSDAEIVTNVEQVLTDDFYDRGVELLGVEKRGLEIEEVNDRTYLVTGNVTFNENGLDYTSPFEIRITFNNDDYDQFRYEWEVF